MLQKSCRTVTLNSDTVHGTQHKGSKKSGLMLRNGEKLQSIKPVSLLIRQRTGRRGLAIMA